MVDILQHSSRNIHPDEVTPEVWGCKQAVVSTYLKIWEKLENSVRWKNLLVTVFLLRSAPLLYFCSSPKTYLAL